MPSEDTDMDPVIDLDQLGSGLRALQERLKDVVFSPSRVEFEQDTYLKVTALTLVDLYDLLSCCLQAGYPIDAPLLEEVTIHVQKHLEGSLE